MSLNVQPRKSGVRFRHVPLAPTTRAEISASTPATSYATQSPRTSDRLRAFRNAPLGYAHPGRLALHLGGALIVAVVAGVSIATCYDESQINHADTVAERALGSAQKNEWLDAARTWDMARIELRRERPNNGTFGVIDWNRYVDYGINSVAASLRAREQTTGRDFALQVLAAMRQDVMDWPQNEGNYRPTHLLDLDLLGKLDIVTAFVQHDTYLTRAAWKTYAAVQHTNLFQFRSWLNAHSEKATLAGDGKMLSPFNPLFDILYTIDNDSAERAP